MKIRNGFVSNSSSSSFVVALKKKPESAEELKKMLFGDKEWEGQYTTENIAQSVFNNMDPASCSAILDEFEYRDDGFNQAESFVKRHSKDFIFIVEYSDNDGSLDAYIEHENVFRNVPSERIYKH